MKIKHIDHIGIAVKSIAQACRFYAEGKRGPPDRSGGKGRGRDGKIVGNDEE